MLRRIIEGNVESERKTQRESKVLGLGYMIFLDVYIGWVGGIVGIVETICLLALMIWR